MYYEEEDGVVRSKNPLGKKRIPITLNGMLLQLGSKHAHSIDFIALDSMQQGGRKSMTRSGMRNEMG